VAVEIYLITHSVHSVDKYLKFHKQLIIYGKVPLSLNNINGN
jgi:hypothetical protein